MVRCAMAKSSRNYQPTVLKKLFALSRNCCAFPRCEEVLSKPEWPKVLAEVCHIAGLNAGSARYDPAMTVAERNSYENLLLLCPNHHDLIDELEPDRFSVDDLLDMKRAHETRRADDTNWCTDELAEQFVSKLARTHDLILLAPGEQAREPIRSGTPMPESVLPEERGRSYQPQRPHWASHEPEEAWPAQWLKTPRVRDLARELEITQREVMDLCDALGVPFRTKETRLSEPYADMVRRRAMRDGLTRGIGRLN